MGIGIIGVQDPHTNVGGEALIRIGEVVEVNDEYDGLRIKVRIDQDSKTETKDLPYAFPLLPKTIQSVPKKGEAVLIIVSSLGNKNSIRYYIGPLISQPQFFYDEKYNGGFGTSNSLLQGSISKPLESISHYNETKGSFPEINDVALIGRKSEDIILKDGEIDIRCGIRGKKLFDYQLPNKVLSLEEIKNGTKADSGSITPLQGDVVFNTQSPAYLQLKYQRGLCKGNKQIADSVINLVADKINLISHKDAEHHNLTDQENLINPNELDEIMSKLHQVPYGDLLVDALIKIRNGLVNHVHSYPGKPPVMCSNMINVMGVELDKILSENVRIS